MFEYNKGGKVQFFRLTSYSTNDLIWINTDHIICFKQKEDYTHIDMTDNILHVRETADRIVEILRGNE